MLDFCSIPIIAALCFGFIEVLKRTFQYDAKLKNAYPLIAAILGTSLGVIAHVVDPSIMITDSVFTSALAGMISGLSATGSNEIIQRMKNPKIIDLISIDNSPPKFYITGDKHRCFDELIEFCKRNKLRRKDVIVILGDSGFNYYGDERDEQLKKQLSAIDVTLFCIHGNKENRPENIPTYGVQTFCGGIVYYEPKYPNIFFAKDGEIYSFNGKKFMAIGGAHSVDKIKCIEEKLPFWNDEMPNFETKQRVASQLELLGNKVDGFLTHTCPISCLPTEMFISTKRAAEKKRALNQIGKKNAPVHYALDIDRSTEEWLETIMQGNEHEIWYCGHYHVDKTLGKIRMLYKEIIPFCKDAERL